MTDIKNGNNCRRKLLSATTFLFVLFITLQATASDNTGLILIRAGTSGEAYAESIAKKRNWRFMAVKTSMIESIQTKVSAD